jgi:hypothetical protein
MNLEQLIALGALTERPTFVEREVKWNGHTFAAKFKTEMNAADYEFIYSVKRSDEDSYVARRISRLVLLAGDVPIPYDEAKKFKHSLLVCIAKVLTQVEEEAAAVAKDEKKPSSQKKNSGTSLSSPVSAEEPSPKPSEI